MTQRKQELRNAYDFAHSRDPSLPEYSTWLPFVPDAGVEIDQVPEDSPMRTIEQSTVAGASEPGTSTVSDSDGMPQLDPNGISHNVAEGQGQRHTSMAQRTAHSSPYIAK